MLNVKLSLTHLKKKWDHITNHEVTPGKDVVQSTNHLDHIDGSMCTSTTCLCALITSLRSGIIPNLMKLLHNKPILKSQEFRPIALTSILSECLKRLAKQFSPFMKEPHQFVYPNVQML